MMKRWRVVAPILFILLVWGANSFAQTPFSVGASDTPQSGQTPSLGHLPLRFEENRGQADAAAHYVARGSGGVLLFCDHEIVVAVPQAEPAHESDTTLSIVRLSFPGSNPNSLPVAEDASPGFASYFKGQNPKAWATSIPTYRRVVWPELYPGIDLVCYGKGNRLEYDFVVQPGADPGVIRMVFDGVDDVRVDEAGDLRLDTGAGEVVHQSPVVSQESEAVAGAFRMTGEREVAFSLGEYDPSQALVIDPVILFCSFLGGNNTDKCTGIGELPDGTVVVAGYTYSSDFPVKDSVQGYRSDADVFVTGITPDGQELVFSTYLGGSGGDWTEPMTIAPDGSIWVGGQTLSDDIPLVDPVQSTRAGNSDAFIMQLDPSGTNILFSTFYGGASNDGVYDLAVDSATNVYFVGETYSSDFPMVNAVHSTSGGGGLRDGFSAGLNASRAIVFSTYLGGTGGDGARGVAVDSTGAVCVGGFTSSSDFQPLGSAVQPTHGGGNDAFVTKLTAAGTLVWSTYLGGTGSDGGSDIAIDSDGNVFVGGYANSGFPLVNAIRSTFSGEEGFLSKIRANGTGLIYSTLIGGNKWDRCYGVTVDAIGNAYAVGETDSSDFPMLNSWGTVNVGGSKEAFIVGVDSAGNDWLFSGQFGGSYYDSAQTVSLAGNGDLLLAGTTYSTDFPVLNALQDTMGADDPDGFFARMNLSSAAPIPFFDGFEWGRFNGCWAISRAYIMTDFWGPHHDRRHMYFGTSTMALSEATLTIDLAGRTSTTLSFWYKHLVEAGGVDHSSALPATFTGSVNGNGVAISDDGVNWVKIFGLSDSEGLPSTYTEYAVELDPIMAAHGLSNANQLFVKFMGYSGYPSDGYHLIDDITILSRSVQFQSADYSTSEGQAATLTVVRSGNTDVMESVDYATIAGNAIEGVDYVGETGTVTFAVGDASGTITVQVNDDTSEEPHETFRVRLSNPSPSLELGLHDIAVVTIQDDDFSEVFPFHVGFESGVLGSCWTTYTETDGVVVLDENDGSSGYPDTSEGIRSIWLDATPSYGLEELILHIDLTGQQNVTLSFLVNTISGDNFTLPDTFTGHANGKGVAISTDGTTWYKVQGLTDAEIGHSSAWRNFAIDLDAAMAARGLTYGFNVQIKFNVYGNRFFDAIGFDNIQLYSPSFEFAQVDVPVLETDDALLMVLRKGLVSGTASVNYQSANGSASAGTDYTAVSGTLLFGDGVASNTITVPVLRDVTVESDKTFLVTLSSPSTGYSIGTVNPTTVTIKDDDAAASMPVQENFNSPLTSFWTSYGQATVAENELQLLGDGVREAILTVDALAQTNVYLNLRYRDMSWGNHLMPDTFSGHHSSDGVAVSVDGSNWVKVLGLTYEEGPTETFSYTNVTVFLDPILSAHGLVYNQQFKLKFQNYSTFDGSEFDIDDIIVYSRQPLDITTTNLPHGTGMVAYATSLATSNGNPPYSWTVSNALPAGLSLSETGELSGTPTEEGSFPLDIFVEDFWGSTGQVAVVLTIDPNVNRPPDVTSRDPASDVWPMGEGTNALFTLEAADPEGASLTYTWNLDSATVASAPAHYLHQTAWGDAGDHILDVWVSDGLWSNVLASWTLQVSADNDGDGMSNTWERTYGLDPWDAADAGLDPDGDFLTSLEESQLGTSPTNSDSNGDSLGDGWQDLYGQDPLQSRDMARLSLERLGSVGGFSNATAVAAYGDAVYLGDGLDGWKVFDVSDATDPVLTQSLITVSYAWDATVEGSHLFLADGTNGLIKIDLEPDPFTSTYSQRYIYSPVRVIKSTVVNQMAYVSTYDAVDDFHILDVIDWVPSPFLGDLDTTNSIRDVAIQGDLAYVAGGDGEFSIIDVSDPDAPFARGTLNTAVGSQGFEIAVTGNVAYLGANSGDIYMADISNPDAPVWTHTNTFTSASVQEIIARDGFVFLAQDGAGIYADGGLYAFDVTNSDWSVSITNILSMDYIKDIAVTSNRLYVVDDEQGLVVFDYASDYDQDGLLDDWERRRLGSLAYGADDDPDHDDVTNLGEQRAGLNPMNGDSDGDLMPDRWEIDHLFNPSSDADADDNTDGDPFDNRAEFTADTDPLDSTDYFRVTAISNTLPMVVCFGSSTNRLYTMQGNSNLVHGVWDDVPGAGPRRGVGGADSMGDTNEPPRGPFYRVDVKLP